MLILDCSQSPIFSYDRQNRALTGTSGHLGFIYTDGTGVGVYSGGGREESKLFSINISNVINIMLCVFDYFYRKCAI